MDPPTYDELSELSDSDEDEDIVIQKPAEASNNSKEKEKEHSFLPSPSPSTLGGDDNHHLDDTFQHDDVHNAFEQAPRPQRKSRPRREVQEENIIADDVPRVRKKTERAQAYATQLIPNAVRG
ncbi:MAG: hypothetical protein L6R42_002381 [Xanthoria sp. 1 TBL-2021]|nr:MAG: hypothetical protein L6R42_002381 [Xanthoria sp. 1 TBL-2021]